MNEIAEKHFKYAEPQKRVRLSLKNQVKGKVKAKTITKQ
jgi:hypothetical protein